MIRQEGHLFYSDSGPYGPSWQVDTGTLTVSCDHPGCTATVVAKGFDCNGPVIDSIYLPDGSEWTLGQRDLCSAHALGARARTDAGG